MRRILTPVIVLALCALLSACGSSKSSTPPPTASPKAELAAMRHAANSQHSVHYVSVSSAANHTIRIVADVAESVGIKRITLTDHGHSGAVTVIVSGDSAYMRGDAFGLTTYFGLPQAKASQYAGKWISVPSFNPAFETVSDEVTFPSFFDHLFARQTKLSRVTAAGLIGVHGTVHGQTGDTASATVFAPAHGQPLPVKQTAKSSGDLGSGTVTMSGWNEAVHVSAPKNAVPITTVYEG